MCGRARRLGRPRRATRRRRRTDSHGPPRGVGGVQHHEDTDGPGRRSLDRSPEEPRSSSRPCGRSAKRRVQDSCVYVLGVAQAERRPERDQRLRLGRQVCPQRDPETVLSDLRRTRQRHTFKCRCSTNAMASERGGDRRRPHDDHLPPQVLSPASAWSCTQGRVKVLNEARDLPGPC
jgi:hypothetical protein